MSLAYAPKITASGRVKLRVITDHILILPDPEQKSLIWLPNDPHKRWRTGRIVSMGAGMKVNGRGFVRYGRNIYKWKGPVDALGYNLYPMPRTKVGDRVLYLTWSCTPILLNKIEHHLVRDSAIELVFKEDQ